MGYAMQVSRENCVARRVAMRYVTHMTIQVTVPQFDVGDRLRKAREVTGLDRITFAERVGIARSTVTNVELGHRRPSNLVIRAWADFTGVPAEWILYGYTPRDSNPEPAGLGHLASDLHRPYLTMAA